MAINELSCNGPEVIESFRIISSLSPLVVVMEKRVRLILLEEFLVPLLVPDDPGLKWMVSDVDLLQGF